MWHEGQSIMLGAGARAGLGESPVKGRTGKWPQLTKGSASQRGRRETAGPPPDSARQSAARRRTARQHALREVGCNRERYMM